MADTEGVARNLKPLQAAPTLADEAAEQLREMILSGRIAFGERLVEAPLARELGTSRGTVREALAVLRAEHLVQDIPRRGAFVVNLSTKDVIDILDLRAAIETTALRLAFERDYDTLINRLSTILEHIKTAMRDERAIDAGGASEVTRLDLSFHEAIVEASGNPRLVEVLRQHASMLRVIIAIECPDYYYPDASLVIQEHEGLFEAIRSGNLEDAQSHVLEHLEAGKRRIAAILEDRANSAAR